MATARFRPPRPNRTPPTDAEAPIPRADAVSPSESVEIGGIQSAGRGGTGPFVRAGENGGDPGDEELSGAPRQTPRVRAPRRAGPRAQGDLVGKQGMQGHLSGTATCAFAACRLAISSGPRRGT